MGNDITATSRGLRKLDAPSHPQTPVTQPPTAPFADHTTESPCPPLPPRLPANLELTSRAGKNPLEPAFDQSRRPGQATRPSLRIGGAVHRPIESSDVRPGDIICVHKSTQKTIPQRLIKAGQQIANAADFAERGSTDVVHTAIVLRVYEDGTMDLAEATGKKNAVSVNRRDPKKGHNGTRAEYLVYRMKDEAVRSEMVKTAELWASSGDTSYSKKACLLALMPATLGPRGREAALDLADHGISRTLPNLDMMCSQFVASVGVEATLQASMTPGQSSFDELDLQNLERGRSGSVFNVNPNHIMPVSLHGRLLDNAAEGGAVEVVGYVSARPQGSPRH